MKPNTPTVIPISQVTSFLVHPGARLAHFQEAPGASFAVEGGWFQGQLFDGAVFTPTVPTIGSNRIDSVVANPDSGAIEIVEGVENTASPPSLPSSPAYGLIANVTVFCRTNGKVIVEAADIEDRRSLIQRVQPSSRLELVDEAIISIGSKNSTSDSGLFLVGQTKGPFVCKKQWGNKPNHGLAFDYGRSSGVEVQLAAGAQVDGKPASDFMLDCQFYGSAIQAGTSESHKHFVGLAWQRLSTTDWAGNASFRIEVVASPQDGSTGLVGSYYDASGARKETKRVNVHVQLWQRISS